MSWIAFTVDLEEWFHLLDTEAAPRRSAWTEQEVRVEGNTHRLLDLLSEVGVKATFFTLGWIAERYPGLVREVAGRGHEIASHGHEHLLAYRVGREAFRRDARRARATLEEVTGGPVLGYRAAGFSITEKTPWAFDELAAAGYRYDSSIFPAPRGHGGFRGGLHVPHRISSAGSGGIMEFPLPPLPLGPLRIPFSGGGYLRLLPARFVSWGLGRLLRQGIPGNVYVHPRDLDPGQPRLRLPPGRRFRSYVNLSRGESKIRYLLSSFPSRTFRTLGQALEALETVGESPVRRL